MRLATQIRSNRVPVLVLALALLLTPLLNSTPAEGVSPGVEVVYVADGRSFADALVGSALAAANNTSLLTVEGTRAADLVPQATKDELTRLKPKSIVILGGLLAISQKVQDELGTYTDPQGNTSRLKGDDRYATATAISQAMPDAVKKALFADLAADAELLDGKDSTAFADATHDHDADYLAKSGKAADADQLDGMDSSDFLGSGDKAADADMLDGMDSSDFLAADGEAADSDLLDGMDATAFAPALHSHSLAYTMASPVADVSNGSWGSALATTTTSLPAVPCDGIDVYVLRVTATATVDAGSADDVQIGVSVADGSPPNPHTSTVRTQTIPSGSTATLTTDAIVMSYGDATPTVHLMLTGNTADNQTTNRGIVAQHFSSRCLSF